MAWGEAADSRAITGNRADGGFAMEGAALPRSRAAGSPAAGGVPHQAHERLALPLWEIREESNQVSEIGGHPKWSGIFLACSNSPGFRNNFDSPWGYCNGRAARECEWRGRFVFGAGDGAAAKLRPAR